MIIDTSENHVVSAREVREHLAGAVREPPLQPPQTAPTKASTPMLQQWGRHSIALHFAGLPLDDAPADV
jgi:hypothetical protein